MAGDWIKIRHALPRSGNVVRIMSACDADKLRTLGGLVSALLLFDEQTDCGHLSGYTLKAFDELIGLPGLGAALCDPKVGWMEQNEDGLTLLEWDKHNGSSAKRRANDAFRKSLTRAENASGNCPQDVRKMSAEKKTKCGPEKRREEKNIISLPAQDEFGAVVIPPCTKSDVDLYAGMTGIPDEIAQEWFEKHDAEDWRPYGGNPPMTTKSWKFDLKNFWQRRKAKDDERRNTRNGNAKAGKVEGNPRNSHLPDGAAEEARRVADMEDVRDGIWASINYPAELKKFNARKFGEHPEYKRALEWIRERNDQEGKWFGIYTRLAEQKFIHELSGRWIANDR